MSSLEDGMHQLAKAGFFRGPSTTVLAGDCFKRVYEQVGVGDGDLRTHRSGLRVYRRNRFARA
jgi:hypothetical protein